MFNRKVFTAALVVVVAGLVLAACMNNDSTTALPESTAQSAPRPSAAPTAGAQDGAAGLAGDGMQSGAGSTANTANGALSPFDWANGAADIEAAIGRISEISEARVVVTGTTALVGVKFDNAYKGEMTERIREMVAAEVLKADPAIQTVAVTGSPEDVQKVYALSDQVRAGRTADDLSAEINAIVRNATTMR